MALLVTIARGDAGATITLQCERFDHKIQRLAHFSPVEKFRNRDPEPPYVSDGGSYQEYYYLTATFITGVAYEAFIQQCLTFWKKKGADLKIGEAAEVDYIERKVAFVSVDGSHASGTKEWTVILALGVGQWK